LPQPHRGHGDPERRRDADGPDLAPSSRPRATCRRRSGRGETLARLAEAGLLEQGWPPPAVAPEVVRRVGIGAAILLPAVASVVAPTPAEAAVTCVSDCSQQKDGTACNCYGEPICDATCISGSCSAGGC
jgi:hypothetical protein